MNILARFYKVTSKEERFLIDIVSYFLSSLGYQSMTSTLLYLACQNYKEHPLLGTAICLGLDCSFALNMGQQTAVYCKMQIVTVCSHLFRSETTLGKVS